MRKRSGSRRQPACQVSLGLGHHGSFAHTGQGQVSLPLSCFFYISFVRLIVCVCGGGLARQAVIMGLSPIPGKDKSVFLSLSSFVCLFVCGEGLTWSSGGFHNTGQGQVCLPVSLFRFLSPSFSLPFSLFPFFAFLLFACVCGGGGVIAVIRGVSPRLGKDQFLSPSVFLFFSSFLSLPPALFLFLSFITFLCWCVWRGVGNTVDELYCQKQDLEISVPWSVCKQNRCCIKLCTSDTSPACSGSFFYGAFDCRHDVE